MKDNLLLLILCIVLVVCCTPTSNVKAQTTEQAHEHLLFIVNIEMLYGLLKKTESGYVFSNFKTGPQPSTRDEAWVNLVNGLPIWDTQNRRCGKGYIKDRKTAVPDCADVVNDKLFLESNFDVRDAGMRVLGAAFTLGLTLTGASYDVTFNASNYKTAYEQAYGRINKETLTTLSRELTSFKADFKRTHDTYHAAASRPDINIRVNDQSGLYSNQIDFAKMIQVKPTLIAIPSITVEAETLEKILDDVRRYKQDLHDKWSLQTADAEIKYLPTTSQFNYEWRGPRRLPVKDGAVRGEVFVDVTSKNVDHVMPRSYEAKDANLVLRFDGYKITFVNRTAKFIMIDSIAFYYNGKIAQRGGLALEMAPQSETLPQNALDISRWPIDHKYLAFRGITKPVALQTEVEIGFAVKYRLVDTNKEQSFFSKKKYSLYELIAKQ